MDTGYAAAPQSITSANEGTQLAWVLLEVCWSSPGECMPEFIDNPYLREELVVGPDHPFTRLVALGRDAVPACIELLRPENDSIDFQS